MSQSINLGDVPGGSGFQVRSDFNDNIEALASQNSGSSAPTKTYPYMLWRRTTDGDLLVRNAANDAWNIIEHYVGANPAAGDDIADGFIPGTMWFNTTSHAVFICNHNALGAAVWTEIAVGGGGGGGGGGVTSVFGRTAAVTAQAGDYNAGQITETAGAKLMTAAERTKLAAINAYWSSRLASDPSAWAKNVALGAHELRTLVIYYGSTATVNGVTNTDYIAALMARYDDVVLGYGLQSSGHANYASTTSVIAKAKTLNPNLMVWGNIDVGLSGGTSHNHPTGTLQTHVDQWVTAGATGIFCDNFGYDRGVTRSRQNTIINYIHGKPLPAMVYATAPADALASVVNATYNPTGVTPVIDSRDAAYFDWSFNSDTVASPYFQTFATMKTRGDDARNYRASLGVRIFGGNVLSFTGRTATELETYRGIAEALAHIWRLDGFGLSLGLYAASGADSGVLQPYHARVIPQPGGRKTAPYRVNGANTEVEASDLGIIVHYESGQYTWSAPSYGSITFTSGGGGGGTGTPFGLTPPSVQTSNGNAPNADCVLLKGAVSDVTLLPVATGRWVQVLVNSTAQTVTVTPTSPEEIQLFPSGFGIPTGEAINVIRDPDDNSWWVL